MAKMEGEMITLHYVMSVELAIEREIVYRKKMDISKNLCQNLEPLLPLQVPPSSRVGLKRKEPSLNILAFLTKQPSSGVQTFQKRSKGFVCKACQMDFSTVSHLKQHSETPRHTGHILGMKRRGQNVSTPFLCKLCDSSCSSASVMENHLNGMKHAVSLQEFENAKKVRDEAFAAYR